MSYTPYRIGQPILEQIRSRAYRAFVERNVLAAGIELLVERRRRNPGYPFPDFKFNPNTGEDYPPAQYDTVFTWFLGRGSEACVRHLELLGRLEELHDLREEAQEALKGYVQRQNEAILEILERNEGRVPFRVNRRLEGIDAGGRRIRLSPEGCNASELFCAKALLASGRAEEEAIGLALFMRFLEAAFRNGYEDDTASYGREIHAEGPFMLSLGAIDYLARAASLRARQGEWRDLAARLLVYVLDYFWEPQEQRFFELVRFDSKEKQPLFVPGHACELVGLGFQAIAALEQAEGSRPPAAERGQGAAFERARRELPRILASAFELAYDHVHGGMYQSLDPESGRVISSDLPWWCMPETMRAAAHAAAVAPASEARRAFLEILATVSNDYFAHFPNPAAGLFPFRTRSGETGEVKNLMPVVPEADPLYHTNLALIDMLEVIGRIRE